MKQDLEKELQKALRRVEPAPDFADRVLARIAEKAPEIKVETPTWRQRLVAFLSLPSMQWAAAGALACLLVAVGVQRYRAYQHAETARLALEQAAEEAEGQRAKEQVMLALQIASAKLNVAQRKVRESSERLPEAR